MYDCHSDNSISVIYSTRFINYAPKNIYSAGVGHDDQHVTIKIFLYNRPQQSFINVSNKSFFILRMLIPHLGYLLVAIASALAAAYLNIEIPQSLGQVFSLHFIHICTCLAPRHSA